ncbi:heterokaryon incompatibility protein-domain-containing protein [Sordaria brevicollis]|uniref:Heterokaryon incompatibility protein-domain-containing protein n=1 Tax=Sordaria brevicollis TaxID=83679 RepID=A0AAE0PLC1_SORBR|nr:heterokaryon incompatibility protein-domain-containing protein [Sordaria brevicollis]
MTETGGQPLEYQPSPDNRGRVWEGRAATCFYLTENVPKELREGRFYDLLVQCVLPTRRGAGYSVTFHIELLDGHSFVTLTHYSSPKSLLLARSWLDECVQTHERCRSRQEDTSWCPTRLLNIAQNERLETTVRLINTDQEKPAGPYGTVTHRWGFTDDDKERVVLTQATYPTLFKGILLSSMPRLFQDIITVAHELGLRYIWIDAFCIFQDNNNNNDWHRESSLMQRVYSNSYCNMSAADANSCSGSLVKARKTSLIAPAVAEHNDKKCIVWDPIFWRREVILALVNTRGWVLQERVLSPRVLHFGKRQIIWECCEHSAAESFPAGVHPRIFESQHTLSKERDLFFDTKRTYADREGEELKLYYLWANLVESYSACKLTFQSDKLVACSGLAKIIQARIKDKYVVGMWRRYLEHELLWVPRPLGASQKKTNHLPSWTWASLDGRCERDPVQYYDTFLYKVESVNLQYASDDPTGDILPEGRLHLRGILMPTILVQTTHDQPDLYWKVIIEDVELEGSTRYVHRFVKAEPYRDGSPVWLNHYQKSFDVENTEGKIFAMPAWMNTYGIGTQRSVMTILLFRLLNAENALYERLGIFKQCDESCKLIFAMREDANGERRKSRERVPCVEFKRGCILL